jgi:hypothetical protein
MATTMTLAQLRTATRQRADQVNSQFVSDDELNSYINQSYFELYDILIQKYGDNYFSADPAIFETSSISIPQNGLSVQYPLPNGVLTFTNGRTGATGYVAPEFYKLLGVDLILANQYQSCVSIKPFNFAARNDFSVPNFQSFYGVTNLRYRLNDDYLWLTPVPAAGQKIQVWYVPRLTTLSADADTCDGISGWTEYIICDAAIKCMQKEESDCSVLIAQKMALIQRIEAAGENRDAANPATIADTQYQDWVWPNGSGGRGSGAY